MEMTSKEIKEVYDAILNGETVQCKQIGSGKFLDIDFSNPEDGAQNMLESVFERDCEWIVKPEPTKIELYGYLEVDGFAHSDTKTELDTHKLTYLLDENNEPICESVKLEKL